MKSNSKLTFFAILVVSIILNLSTVKAQNVYIRTNKAEIEIGEEVSLIIDLSNTAVSAFDFNIFFDTEILEYKTGPENTNVINNKIITTWYDETGGKTPKNNCELVKYTFKAKKTGETFISTYGEIYDTKGLIESIDEAESIKIKENVTTEERARENTNVTPNDSKLKELKINVEGISPEFSPDITQYYFVTQELDRLNITAIPENENAKVTITGNNDFKQGNNEINIEVKSQDNTSTTNYKINVTKTDNIENANSYLENLAIEYYDLAPEFNKDIYDYKIEVTNITEKLNILAIPENINSKVNIIGGDNLQYGNNKIEITVTAPDGITVKKYNINAYKRTEEEQKKVEEEQKENAEKLTQILQQNNEENVKVANKEIEKNNRRNILIGIIIIAIIGGIILGIWHNKKKNRKQ